MIPIGKPYMNINSFIRKVLGGACGVMVIVVGNEPSSLHTHFSFNNCVIHKKIKSQ